MIDATLMRDIALEFGEVQDELVAHILRVCVGASSRQAMGISHRLVKATLEQVEDLEKRGFEVAYTNGYIREVAW